ncbi:MAG: DNA/RNA non-specific endonuclease [Janthinobacterium lividum]
MSLEQASHTHREGAFHPDDRLPQVDGAQLEDYRKSGYNRGHMTPSGDMPGEQAQQQSFSLANMVPQTAELNRGIWARIESAVRKLTEQESELYLVTGPAFRGDQIKSIGPNGVLVPTSTWKAVYDPRVRGTGVYVCKNTDQPTCDIVSITTHQRPDRPYDGLELEGLTSGRKARELQHVTSGRSVLLLQLRIIFQRKGWIARCV